MAHPRMYDDSDEAIKRLREICLALPQATEKEAWGECTFRVGGKMFAMTDNNHHGDGRVAVWCKAPIGFQKILVESKPDKFFVPPYVGHKGWVGVRLDIDDVEWGEVADILEESYRMTAPKKLAARPARTVAKSAPPNPRRKPRPRSSHAPAARRQRN